MKKRLDTKRIYSSPILLNRDFYRIVELTSLVCSTKVAEKQKLSIYVRHYIELENKIQKVLFYLSTALHNTPNNETLKSMFKDTLKCRQSLQDHQYDVIKNNVANVLSGKNYPISIKKHFGFLANACIFRPTPALYEKYQKYRSLMKTYAPDDAEQEDIFNHLLVEIKKEQILRGRETSDTVIYNDFLKYCSLSPDIVNIAINTVLKNSKTYENYVLSRLVNDTKINLNDLFSISTPHNYTKSSLKITVKEIFISLFSEFKAKLNELFRENYVELKRKKPIQGWHIGCQSLRQSRIYLSIQNSISDVFNLSHELGHAYGSYIQGKNSLHTTNLSTIEFGAIFCELYSYKWVIKHQTKQAASAKKLLIAKLLKYLCVPAEQYLFESELLHHLEKNTNAIDFYDIIVKALSSIYGEAAKSFCGLNKRIMETSQYFHVQPYYSLSYLYAFFAAYYSLKKFEEDKNFIMTIRDVMIQSGHTSITQMYEILGIDINSPTFYKTIVDDINSQIITDF